MSNEDITNENIPERILVYDKLFRDLNIEVMKIKNGLDLYQIYLHRINSIIQLSVIFLSVSSSFFQALNSKNYEVIFNSSPDTFSTNITLNESINIENTFDQNTYSKIVPIITLSISTYSALVISMERHFSFESREGNVNNLKGLYSELISRIKYYRELMDPWNEVNYYMIDKSNKLQEWKALCKKIELEYTHIIDIKRELYTSYEKIIDSNVYDRYQKSFKHGTEVEENSEP